MKKLRLNLMAMLAAFGVLFLASCNDETETPIGGTEDEVVNTEAEIDADFEDVDNITLESLESNVYSEEGSPGSRVAHRRHHIPDCAEVTHNYEEMTITINFGEACELRNGKVVSGVIFITYTDRKFIPGSLTTTTLQDFYVDGKLIEGTRVVENISATLEDNPTFHITLTGGKITLEDGTFATRDADKTVMWIRADNPLRDEFHVLEGSTAYGFNFEGIDYSINIIETIIYKNFCDDQFIKAPVSGVKQVIKGEMEWIIDFGDGECDSLVTVTHDGESWTVEIQRRKRINGNAND